MQNGQRDGATAIAGPIHETAHDLRAPLETVRASVRLVRDGDLGKLSVEQRVCLDVALNQCDCATQMIDEMVQSDRFESGFPMIRRGWISIDRLREAIESTLRPWAIPRRIRLLWDGPFGSDTLVYGDPTLLRRLVVNLANNSFRVSPDGGTVLIRAIANRASGEMVWAVVDRGTGISPADMTRIENGSAPIRNVSGLGMCISRRLAAAHFSPLHIESRIGTGTAVSFRTPIGGPTAVVARWVKWRKDLLDSDRDVDRSGVSESRRTQRPVGRRRVRIDGFAPRIRLGLDHVRPAFADQVYLTGVSVGAAVSKAQADEFDALVQRASRLTDLVYRAGDRTWVIALDADRENGHARQSELDRLVHHEIGGVRMTWGPSMMVQNANANSGHVLASRLSDLVVRQTLVACRADEFESSIFEPIDDAILPSIVPSQRLEEQLDFLDQQRLSV